MARTVLVLATLCAFARPAVGDTNAARADAAAREAEALVAAGDFASAAAKYREAYAADSRVELMCNVGVAYHKAKDLWRAHLYLSQCLDRGTALESEFVAAVRGVLTQVESALKAGDYAPVDIVVEPRATTVELAADITFLGPRLVWLPFGSHTLRFRAEGHLDRSLDITIRDRTQQTLSATLAKKPDPAPVVVEKPVRLTHERRAKWPAIATTALTVGTSILAYVAYTRAHARSDVAAFALTDEIHDDDEAYIAKWNAILGASVATAVLGAAASGFLWYRATTPETRVELAPTTTGATVTFRGSF